MAMLQRAPCQLVTWTSICRRFFDSGDVPLNLLQREYARFIADFCQSQRVLEPHLTLKVRAPYATKKPKVWTEAQVRRFEKDDAYRAQARAARRSLTCSSWTSVRPRARSSTVSRSGKTAVPDGRRNALPPGFVALGSRAQGFAS